MEVIGETAEDRPELQKNVSAQSAYAASFVPLGLKSHLRFSLKLSMFTFVSTSSIECWATITADESGS
jgi:hypothetical protein